MAESDALLAGRYRLMRRLGAGGMGVVWHAWDERLRRPVAVKQLRTQQGMTEAETQVASERAMREARINARLHHSHAVSVFDVVEHEGQPCLIMQYLPSQGLDAVLAEAGRLAPREAARIGGQVASALAAAHQAGIVHRDVKPGNILITQDGVARISDFGISRAVWDVTLTSTGMLAGTPAFLAPEVARGEQSSFPSDVFSLGATLYAAVEAVPPFGASENPMALLHQVASGQLTPPRAAGALTPLLMRMLAPAPQDRPPMEEVALALEALAGSAEPHLVGLGAAEPAPLPTAAPGAVPTLPAAGLDPTASRPRTGDRVTTDSMADRRAAGTQSAGTQSAGPRSPGRRHGRGSLLAAAAVLLVLGAALAAFVAGRSGSGGPDVAAPARSVSSPAPVTPAPSARPPASATSAAAAASPAPAPTAARTAGPPTTPATAGPPTAADLAQAVTGYYALMPGNTDAGWARLTAAYQRSTAESRQTYEAFWRSISNVSVTGATGALPGSVQATVTYTFADGRMVRERTAYGLVRDAGVLKINSSRVISSQQL